MMYMDDAIKATIQIMQADSANIKIRSSYNLAAMSFTPKELAEEISKHYPSFKITYEPDFRQKLQTAGLQALMILLLEKIGAGKMILTLKT